ncbi:MAG: beta galactosidase jelly roll domain-containing protein, partial [Candidatus Firestonebacteria bacterium]
HWKQRKTIPVIADVSVGGWKTDTGVLAQVSILKGELIWVSVSPSDFNPEYRPDLIFTKVNTSRLISQVMTNCGIKSGVSWLPCFSVTEGGMNDISLHGIWRVRQDKNGVGAKEGWMKAETDERSKEWSDMKVPGMWGEIQPDWNGYIGDVWYRLRFKVAEKYKNVPLEFLAGAIDDTDEAWLNGEKIGETSKSTVGWWAAERHYSISDGLLKFGKEENILTIRINNNLMDAGFVGPVNIEVPMAKRYLVNHYLDTRKLRDNPYAYMRW